MERIEITVEGMSCGGCENAVRAAVGELPGVTEVTADHTTGKVVVVCESPVPHDEIGAAVGRAGFTTSG